MSFAGTIRVLRVRRLRRSFMRAMRPRRDLPVSHVSRGDLSAVPGAVMVWHMYDLAGMRGRCRAAIVWGSMISLVLPLVDAEKNLNPKR